MASPNGFSSFAFGRNFCILGLSASRRGQRALHSGNRRGNFNLKGYCKTQQEGSLSSSKSDIHWKSKNYRTRSSRYSTNSASQNSFLKNPGQFFRKLQCSNSRNLVMSRRLRGQEPWMISDYEVNSLINRCETAATIDRGGIIDRYDTNQLASNQPIEDRKFIVNLLQEEGGYLFGVLDGHGGDACAQSVCHRLPDYLGLALLRPEVLMELNHVPEVREYLTITSDCEHDSYNYMDDPICRRSLYNYFEKLKQMHASKTYQADSNLKPRTSRGLFASLAELHDVRTSFKVNALTHAFLNLDHHISEEALRFNEDGEVNQHAFAAANAGACALVAYINGTELCIANTGDCRAVLGVENDDGSWSAIQLSSDHTAGNQGEVQRIVNQHPIEEATTCIQYERLLNRLAPLRAFGDVRFKWDSETQKRVYSNSNSLIKYFTEQEHLYTPPYLTAEPEVTSYQLQRSDKFLVLATDGLWDMLNNEEVVHFVKQHVKKKNNPEVEKAPLEITYNQQELPCEMLNSASCLVREALGGDDHVSVSTSLSIPFPDVRMYRDDMTIIVVFFDWDKQDIPSESELEFPLIS